ncbi:MAG: Protease synthase and sporulation protein PAI 2 [Anaerolineales bacterium]|nr:Protease synthase and sporulation protein PAI 2 [Anaerolineales bacterium]HQU37906.1 FMN-binding negative transcriptional regulator [Anaerolineales bacterium]
MYTPKLYREEDRAKIIKFLRQNEFAILVTYDGEKPTASHLLVEIFEEGEKLFINGHMSRANPLWKTFEKNAEVLTIFHGPHTYISPTWYNHVNVPTWNYQAVHVYGKLRIVEDYDEAYQILKRLTDRHETASHYKLETLPQDFVAKEIKGIVAFQIEVTKIEANYKLSQNRNDEDYQNIVERLEEREDEMSHEVAEAMKSNRQTRRRSPRP